MPLQPVSHRLWSGGGRKNLSDQLLAKSIRSYSKVKQGMRHYMLEASLLPFRTILEE